MSRVHKKKLWVESKTLVVCKGLNGIFSKVDLKIGCFFLFKTHYDERPTENNITYLHCIISYAIP